MRIFVPLLVAVLLSNPILAEQILIKQDQKQLLSAGRVLEVKESRFEQGASQILVSGVLRMKGKRNNPAVITFSEKPFDFKNSKIKTIDIDKDTLVYLPESTTVVEYTPRTYSEKGFEQEINGFLLTAAKFYPILFIIAATAVATR